MGTAVAQKFGIAFAGLSASINSDPALVKAYATDFCGVKGSARCNSRSSGKLRRATLQIGLKKTVMRCSVSSTAIPFRKKVPHEKPDYRPARRRSAALRTRFPTGFSSSECNEPDFSGRHRSLTTRSPWQFLSPADFLPTFYQAGYCTPKLCGS
jgi:hypothetical protein